MSVGHYLFSFQGRINRSKWWIFVPLSLVVLLAVIALVIMIVDHIGSTVGLSVVGLTYVALLYVGFAVGAKRLHDRSKSGWWMLVSYLVPVSLGLLGKWLGAPLEALLLNLIGLAILIWGFIELGCLRGTPGSNEYGPDPLTGSAPSSPR